MVAGGKLAGFGGEMTRQESQVIFRMTAVMARPISRSARGSPTATSAALAMTLKDT
jgi:hypothetical protein